MLEQINHPNDIKKIPVDQLPQLAADIRRFLIDSISKTAKPQFIGFWNRLAQNVTSSV